MRVVFNGDVNSLSANEHKAIQSRLDDLAVQYRYAATLDVVVNINDDGIEITHEAHAPFDRIRRITGYLVGTIDRWNNAKRAEEHDRVKHSVAAMAA